MESNAQYPLIEAFKVEVTNFLRFSFKDTLTEKEAKMSIIEWEHIFDVNQGEKFTLIWNCQQMKGYEPGARFVWQNALKKLKNQISDIWVISESTKIRSAVMIIAMITKYKIKVVRSEEEITNAVLQHELQLA